MNGAIRRKLIEAENQSGSIKQQFKRAIALDKNWRKSKREKERLKGKKKNGALAPRQNNQKAQRQILPQPQVWPKKQKMPQQQVPTEPAPMEGVERTNAEITIP